MSEPKPTTAYAIAKNCTSTRPFSSVTYVNDRADVREWLIALRRDYRRKIDELTELINGLPPLDS